jgi:outer membrane receptor for ferrienterochelin and colicins
MPDTSAPANAAADDTSLLDGSEVIVVTGTRTPEAQDAAPVKVDVVTRDEAERRGATNVAEALATQPGVQVNPGAYGYLGGVSAIQIQGFDTDRVLILEDGEPVIGDVGGAIDLSAIPMTDVERIEIVTGPTSALYGSSAIGGVVNIITAPPATDGASARVRAEYRSFHGVLADAVVAYRRARWWATLDISYTRQDGVREAPSLPDLQIPELSRPGLGVRAGAPVGERADVELKARWLHQQLDGLQSMTYPGLGAFTQQLPETTDRLAVDAIANVRLADRADSSAAPSLRLAAAFQHTRDTSSTIGAGTDQAQRSRETLPSFEATATLPDGARTWVAGVRLETEHLAQSLEDTTGAGALSMQTAEQEVIPRWLWTAAAYGQLQWKLTDTITVLPGVRAEDHGKHGSVVAPRLAVAATPSSAWTLRAGGGRGYRTPSAEELGFNFDHSIYGYKVLGNPGLSPESSWGVDGDVAFHPDGHLTVRAGGFANWVTNLIDIDLASGTTMGSVVSYAYANFEQARTLGGQASAAYRFNDRWSADVAYDYLWTRDDVNRVPLSGRPAHTVIGSLRVGLPWQLDLYARARVVGQAYVDATTSSPGYETVNLRLARLVWRDVEAEAGVNNLFDVHQTPGRVGDLRPPLGRVVYAGVRAALP